ncbi:MAG TPA: ABC transporter permease, partial [Planctomycetes bacterium]|nr:ABC transporter permease [Planctomycetota bacterium]
MNAILNIACKDLRILARDRGGLFFVLVFPLIYALFFGAIFGGGGSQGVMKISVIDQDRSEASQAFLERLGRSPSLALEEHSLAEAEALVRRGKLVAYCLLPKGLGKVSMFAPSGQRPEILVGIDPSRKAEKGFLQGLLAEAWFAGVQETFTDRKKMRAEVNRSLELVKEDKSLDPDLKKRLTEMLGSIEQFVAAQEEKKEGAGASRKEKARQPKGLMGPAFHFKGVARKGARPSSSFEITFPSSILWGIVACVSAFALSMVKERVRGTFLRLEVAPIGRGSILMGKALACFLAATVVCLLLLLFGHFVFGLRIQEPLKLGVGVLVTAFGFSGIMMLVASLGRTEQAVSGASWAILLVLMMLGGGMVPLIAMPGWMARLSDLSPVKWGILS